MNVLLSLANHLTTSGFDGVGMYAGVLDLLFELLGSFFELLFETIFESIFFFIRLLFDILI